jgi:hypothetical protein
MLGIFTTVGGGATDFGRRKYCVAAIVLLGCRGVQMAHPLHPFFLAF